MGLERKFASVTNERVSESNYGSSGSIAAKNQGRKSPAERAEETNLSGLSSAGMTRAE